MALNQKFDGRTFDTVLTAVTGSGVLFLAGDLVGCTNTGGNVGDKISVAVTGVWEVPKASVAANSGFPQGTKLYYDPTANNNTGGLTETAGSLKFAGYAWALAQDSDTTCLVRLVG